MLTTSPGHSQILSRSHGEKSGEGLVPRPGTNTTSRIGNGGLDSYMCGVDFIMMATCPRNMRPVQQAIEQYRPVGSKFEMVRPYYDAMRARNVLGHTHLPSPPPPPPPHTARYPSSRMLLLSNCILGRFEGVVAES